MAESTETTLIGTVAQYGPVSIKDLKVGDTKYWCRCGLSKKQPWCDGSHKGTGMTPMKWTVEKEQTLYYMCACKQTKHPPHCDGNHNNAPMKVKERQNTCTRKDGHVTDCRLCTGCGWVPDF